MKSEKIQNLPRHLGIIMDGNGRWAKRRRLPRVAGHRNATKALRSTVETCTELGLEVLTLYAFSTENWERPAKEVGFLMKLFEEYLKKELATLKKNNIHFRLIGHRHRLPDFVQKPLSQALEETKDNDRMTLCLAMDYGSRDEITKACREIAAKVKKQELFPEEIDEQLISDHLYTGGLGDPDLIIRTSGELRLSNFLLWQAAYSELYFTNTFWPDFDRKELLTALEDYSSRERRLGKINDDP